MSGTFEPKIFMDYFKCPKEHFIDVLGATYPTKDNFLEFDSSNWMEYAIDLIEKIHIENISDITNKNKFSDILIFLQGAAQIKKISDKIHYLNSKIFSKGLEESKKHVEEQQKKYKTGGKAGNKTNSKIDAYYLAPIALMSENISSGSKSYMDLYSNIDSVTVDIYNFDEKGERIDIPIATVPASRRIMAGSNAIETGLTIQTLGYCIDSGFVKESHFNPNFNCQVLIDKNVTQASSRQRRGRVGRNAPGVFYACYTSSVYESLPKLPFPDIVKEDISLFLLNIIIDKTKTTLVEVEYNKRTAECFQMNQFNQQWYKLTREEIFDASSLDFIQYPSADSIGYATEKLHGLGFIDHEYNPTLFGLYGSKFRKIKLENIRMILAGYHHNANILDLVTIACCIQIGHELGIQKKKYKPRNPLRVSEEEANQYYKLLFLDEFIEYLFIWDDFMNAIDSISSVLEKNIKLVKPSKGNIMPVNYLPNWCKENGFKLEGLLKVIELRDEVIETMLTMGLNPYYNGLGLSRGAYNLVNILQRNIQEGIDEIKKIKYCIYEGYRFNVCIWNNISKTYVGTYAHNNITINSKLIKPLTADDDIKQLRPQKIIVSTVTVQQNSNKNIYEFIGGDISVLDGFLDVDIEFLYH
jgi:HrpA-like RNA helicase